MALNPTLKFHFFIWSVSNIYSSKPSSMLLSKLIWCPWTFSSVQLLSRARLFATPWIAARQASLSITNSRSSLRLTSIESVMPSSHLILRRPLLLLPPEDKKTLDDRETLKFREQKQYFGIWILSQWHPTPVLLPGKFHGRRSLVGCSPWGR